jgi:ketosteroid isomerase-like protein
MVDVATSQTADTTATLARHIEAVLSGNADAVMQNFTDESIVFGPDGPVRGLDTIRGDTEAFFKGAPPELLGAIEIVRQDVDGEVAFLLWRALPYVSLAAETFVVRNGKIMVQTFAMFGGEVGGG